jgi:YegS/Rv2252/BmrU family lipid kinase
VKLSLIANPSAGGGRTGRALKGVEQTLTRLGLEHHTEQTRSLEHAQELAAEAAAASELAVAFGGDGLIGAIAGALRHTDAVLGVLPGGRGNDFARALGIPLDPVAACEVLAQGAVREVDLGIVGSRTFIGIASCGFDSDANRIANKTRVVRGNLVYAYGAIRALVSWRPARFEVTIDGDQPRRVTGYTVAAANSNSYGGGMLLAPEASLEDGMLDVVIVGNVSKLRFLRLLPTVFKGTHTRQPTVQILRATEVQISADRPFTMFADGDPIAELPVAVGVIPSAVRVMAPR